MNLYWWMEMMMKSRAIQQVSLNEVPEGTYVIQFENVVDPGASPIADRGGIVIENNGSFTAVASDVEDIVCHGDSDGVCL